MLSSSHAMHASDGWINTQVMIISQIRATCCRSAVFQRSSRRHRLPPVHRLPPWGDLWRKQKVTNVETWAGIFSPTVDGKNVRLTTGNSSPNQVQYDISPHRYSPLSDLTIRLYSSTSLKSISIKWWLYHQRFKLSYWFVQLCTSNSRDQSSSLWLVSRLTADKYR